MKHTAKTKALERTMNLCKSHVGHTIKWKTGEGIVLRVTCDYELHWVRLWIKHPEGGLLDAIYHDQVLSCSCENRK